MNCRPRALVFALSALALSLPGSSDAAFHFWDIAEVFSTADGRVQYVEFITTVNGQHVVGNHQITASSDGTVVSFTIPNNLVAGTANRRFVVATPGFADLPGAVAPDYILPCGPFFNPSATSITINFVGADSLTFTGAQLPTDGLNALVDATPGGIPTLSSAANTPTNYAGDAGSLNLPACVIAGTCDPCDDGEFCNGPELCALGACLATPACPGLMCDEAADRCFECTEPSTCNDDNPCTDDDCDPNGLCTNLPNTEACDDGLFCTLNDACAAGLCVGDGSPCSGQETCLEGADLCGECVDDADCDDGVFCNGAETCDQSACVAGVDPCLPSEICDELAGECSLPEPPDGGAADASDPLPPDAEVNEAGPGDLEPSDGEPVPLDAGGPPPMDAAAPFADAAVIPGADAAGGSDAGNAEADEGCGCRASSRGTSPTSEAVLYVALLGFAGLASRRLGRRSA